jgi:hypothetical protein
MCHCEDKDLLRRVSPFRLCGMGDSAYGAAYLNAESPTFGRETLRGSGQKNKRGIACGNLPLCLNGAVLVF